MAVNLLSNRIDVESIAAIAEHVGDFPIAKPNFKTTKFDLVVLPPEAELITIPTISVDFDTDFSGEWHIINMVASIKFSSRSRTFRIEFEATGKAIYMESIYDVLLENCLYNYMVGLIDTDQTIRRLKVLPMPSKLPTKRPVNDWDGNLYGEHHYESEFYDLKVLKPTKVDTGKPVSYKINKIFN